MIGSYIIDEDGLCCKVTDERTTSIEVFLLKKTDKGINCKQWYEKRDFEKRFRYGIKGYLNFLDNSDNDTIILYFKTKDILEKIKIW